MVKSTFNKQAIGLLSHTIDGQINPYPMISHNIPIGLLPSTQPKLPPSQVTGGPGRLYDRSSGGRDAAAVSLRLGFIGK